MRPESTVPLGLCQCGCGGPAPIAPTTDRKRGYEKGKPRKFIFGHHAYYVQLQLVPATDTDHAWAAGILDGEGTIYIAPRRKRQFTLIVSVGQTSKTEDPAPMLQKLRSHYGGALSSKRRDRRRPHHVWSLSGRSAESFLRLINPFVVAKKDQVQIALEYRDRAVGKPEAGIGYRHALSAAKR